MSDIAWPFYPLAFLHDAARCLALVRQGQLGLNPQEKLQIGSVSRLVRCMLIRSSNVRARSESQAPPASFLMGLLGQAGLIASAGADLVLNATAYDWLGQPAPLQIEQLRQVWWQAPLLNARWLPPSRHQTSQEGQWRHVQRVTCEWAAALPSEQWTRADEIELRLVQAGLVGKVIKGRTLPRVRQAIERRVLGVARFIVEFALPCLGLVDAARQGDGMCIRPTAEGAAWLSAALAWSDQLNRPSESAAHELRIPSQGLRFPAEERPPVTVEPDLSATVLLSAPAATTFDLAHFARLVSPGPPARYQITPDSLRQAVAWGYPATDVVFLLARACGGSLLPEVVAQLDKWQQAMTVITCQAGYRLQAADPVVFHLLRRQEAFRSRTQPLTSGEAAWVTRAQSDDLFRYLRRAGYTLALPREDDGAPWAAYRRALPLPQLAVALRTYHHLRSVLSGLADLGLQDLIHDLSAALTPDEQAAVTRLFESNVILLARHSDEETRGQGDQETTTDLATRDSTDPPASLVASAPSHLVSLSTQLQAAIDGGKTVQIKYADTKANVSTRRVQPLRLEKRWRQTYLVAHCELRQDERSFRLDRILQVIGDQ